MSAKAQPAGTREGARSGVRWVVQCYYYSTKPVASRAAAERMLEQIEAQGDCSGVHRVMEVSR